MIEIQEIREILRHKNLRKISSKSGVNYTTLWKICNYSNRNTSYNTVKKLSDYIMKYEFYHDDGRFMWDDYLRVAKYKDIRDGNVGCPVSIQYAPTMMSTDGKQIYLNTPDVGVFIDNTEHLLYYFSYVYDEMSNFNSGSFYGAFDSDRMSRLILDYIALWNILKQKNKLPEDYTFPEDQISKAIKNNE